MVQQFCKKRYTSTCDTDNKKCNNYFKCNSRRTSMAWLAFIFLPDYARHVFSTAVQHCRRNCRGTISWQASARGSERRKQHIYQSACWIFYRSCKRRNDYHFAILRCASRTGTASRNSHSTSAFSMGWRCAHSHRHTHYAVCNAHDFNARRYFTSFYRLFAHLFYRRTPHARVQYGKRHTARIWRQQKPVYHPRDWLHCKHRARFTVCCAV